MLDDDLQDVNTWLNTIKHYLSSIFWMLIKRYFFEWSIPNPTLKYQYILIIFAWINNPSRIFSKRFLYVWYNRNIDGFKYIINVTLINNCLCFWVWLKSAIFCLFITFYFLKANLVTNSNSLNSDNKSISFYLTGALVQD